LYRGKTKEKELSVHKEKKGGESDFTFIRKKSRREKRLPLLGKRGGSYTFKGKKRALRRR